MQKEREKVKHLPLLDERADVVDVIDRGYVKERSDVVIKDKVTDSFSPSLSLFR